MTRELSNHDLLLAVRRLPASLREMMKQKGNKLIIAGGYLRAVVTGEAVSDIDVFASDTTFAKGCAMELARENNKKVWDSPNAVTVKMRPVPIQFIHRWTFPDPASAIKSFDFTIARAAIWYEHTGIENDLSKGTSQQCGVWCSICEDDYYQDLAAKRLVYCAPTRIEEAGGSLLRVLKFYQRGYHIPIDSLAAVVARCVSGVNHIENMPEHEAAMVITGLLREVDPLIDPDHISHLSSFKGEPDGKS